MSFRGMYPNSVQRFNGKDDMLPSFGAYCSAYGAKMRLRMAVRGNH